MRISKDLKERMRKLPVEWSEEVRRFIESRVRQLELAEKIREIEVRAIKRNVVVDSTGLIREDRER
ncbi:hypothetical protein CP083_01885 [Candidatus Bathyarchaeota archaeon B24-2]|nr:MAG: hypothetical protein CP083_01885 [Candidatus Bathyarchaeota archaeon B24-2]